MAQHYKNILVNGVPQNVPLTDEEEAELAKQIAEAEEEAKNRPLTTEERLTETESQVEAMTDMVLDLTEQLIMMEVEE